MGGQPWLSVCGSGHVVDSETTHVLGIFQFADADNEMNVCCGEKGQWRICCNGDHLQNSSRSGQWTHLPIRLYLIGCIAVHFQNDNSNLMLTRCLFLRSGKFPSLICGVFTSKSKFYSFTLFNNYKNIYN